MIRYLYFGSIVALTLAASNVLAQDAPPPTAPNTPIAPTNDWTTMDTNQQPGQVPGQVIVQQPAPPIIVQAPAQTPPPPAQQPGTIENRTEANQSSMNRDHGWLRDEVFAIAPQVGVVSLNDVNSNNMVRGVVGLIAEGNFLAGLNMDAGKPFFGPQTGFFFSHLGTPGSNVVGTNSPSGSDNGTNLALIPVDAKVGWTFGKAFRIAAHGGGNVIYRNDGVSGSTLPGAVANLWSFYPNVGGDVEFAFAPHVGLSLRPDWTIAPNYTAFTGTAAITFPIG